MALFRGLIKAGIAKKIYDEARKPQNQQRAKDLYAKARQGKNRGSTRP